MQAGLGSTHPVSTLAAYYSLESASLVAGARRGRGHGRGAGESNCVETRRIPSNVLSTLHSVMLVGVTALSGVNINIWTAACATPNLPHWPRPALARPCHHSGSLGNVRYTSPSPGKLLTLLCRENRKLGYNLLYININTFFVSSAGLERKYVSVFH